MAGDQTNPLLSTQKSSDSSLEVALHPLPILEISDYITRGYQRGQGGAIVGGLLGQQVGRHITIEHSFTFKAAKGEDGQYALDKAWFGSRLELMRLVHKSPALDLIGWYTLVPQTGPTPEHLPIHNAILETYNESAILMGFHLEKTIDQAPGDPLPLTIYESNLETEGSNKEAHSLDEDRDMKDSKAPSMVCIKFRELPFTTETGEAEMIAMQFIREGGANGTSGGVVGNKTVATASKGKKLASSKDEDKQLDKKPASILSKEQIELISALQAKANAIKMMQARIGLIIAYLERLPADYVSGAHSTQRAQTGDEVRPSNNILRQIHALVTNLELVTPTQQENLGKELLQESNDVNLVSMVKDLMASISDVRDVGKKFAILEAARGQKPRTGHFDQVDRGQALSSGCAGDVHMG